MKKIFLLQLLLISCSLRTCCQEQKVKIDSLEFQKAYPLSSSGALDQLKSFPSPRYLPNNNFIRLFNWMNSYFMGGATQQGVRMDVAINSGTAIQEELILNWNYFITIQNSGMASSKDAYSNPKMMLKPIIDLANKYPQIPLAVTTFWMQLNPKMEGIAQEKPNILRNDFPDSFYIKDASGKVVKRALNFAAPDSLFIKDGICQKICMQNILSHLTRPLNFINENGEEPPNAGEAIASGDKDMIADKNKLGMTDWNIYLAEKKKHMRYLYSSQFLDLPELKNTWFSIYNVEGGPIDRYDWNTSKASCSKINGNYYSTPDFYPRHPDNWKAWKGAWHGWKWINDGRKVEIKNGDKFFSPFVSPGWANNPELDMRPAQWLGLLKCLSVVGAEFYYTGYFNLRKPYTKPEDYVWQAAMPAYAQAVTTHFSDVFFDGNVLYDQKNEPVITYPVKDNDVLVALRKHNSKAKYVIAATVQPFSNEAGSSPLQKNIEISLDGETITLNARRQGSVYIYDKSVNPAIFYQLDRWHQYEHPERWRKFWINEAEVFDTASGEANKMIRSAYLKMNNRVDLSNVQSYVNLDKEQWVQYTLYKKDLEHLKTTLYVMIYAKSKNEISLNISVNGKENKVKNRSSNSWQWMVYPITIPANSSASIALKLESLSDELQIDKLIISDSDTVPDLKDY